MGRKKTEHVGTITGREIALNAPKGHQSHATGCGAHRDKKRCKKTRRREDARRCRDW